MENYSKEELCQLLIEHNSIPKFIMGSSEYAECLIKALPVGHFNGCIDEYTDKLEFAGVPIVRDIRIIPQNAIVCCASLWHPILAQKRLNQYGLRYIDYFSLLKYCPQLSLKDISFWEGFRQSYFENKNEYESLNKRLFDDESRDVLRRVLDFRWNYNVDAMSIFTDRQKEQYFEPFLKLEGTPYTFIDMGGFDGYTTYDFIQRCPKYKEVYFFEPEEQNIEKAKEFLSNIELHYIPYAASDKQGVVSFKSTGSASSMVENDTGDVTVNADSLDHILAIIPPMDYDNLLVKMDIEGAEELAINGMRETILKCHPTLAIAAYHKGGDLVDIPRQILKIRDDYNLYLRQYTETFIETIMIFVPKKK